jgi:TnsA endonuclease N terminal
MPVRNTNRGYGGLTGHIANPPSNPPGHPSGTRFPGTGFVQFESALEKDLFTLLRYQQHVTREVRSFEEQPLRIDYLGAAGQPRHYTPDALVHYQDGRPTELTEVKYRADLRKKLADLRPGFRAAQALCAERGWVFRVRTEYSIRTPLLAHAAFFPAYLGRTHQPDDVRLVLGEVQRQGNTTVGAVLDVLAPIRMPDGRLYALDQDALRRATLLSVLWTLVAHGFVLLDLSTPPGQYSALRPSVY